jgi:hypothetical protein
MVKLEELEGEGIIEKRGKWYFCVRSLSLFL